MDSRTARCPTSRATTDRHRWVLWAMPCLTFVVSACDFCVPCTVLEFLLVFYTMHCSCFLICCFTHSLALLILLSQ